MQKLLEFCQRHAVFIVVLTIAVSAAFLYAALQVRIDPAVDNLLPEHGEIAEMLETYGSDSSNDGKLFIAFESSEPFQLEGLRSLYRALQEIEEMPAVKSSLHPFNAVTFTKDKGRLQVSPIAPDQRAPEDSTELERFKNRLINDPFYKNKLVSSDGKILGAFFFTKLVVEDQEAFIERYREILTPVRRHYEVYASGDLLLAHETSRYITMDFTKLLIFSIIFMLAFFYFGFGSRRSVFLPISVVILGTIWTLGFMSLTGFALTIISVATPPLVLTIGSSYTIHLLSQFYREAPRSPRKSTRWIVDATLHVNKTILLSALTTVIGFLSLLATSIDQTKELGIATSFGIIACMLLSLFFLPALLSLLPPPSSRQAKLISFGPLSRGMRRLGYFVYKRYFIFLILFGVLIVVFLFSLNNIRHQSDYLTYFPGKNPVVQDTTYILNNIGGFQKINVSFSAPEGSEGHFLQPEILRPISEFEKRILDNPNISSSISFPLFVRELNRKFSGRGEIPTNRGLILMTSRYINLLRSQGGSDNFVSLVSDEDFSQITLTFYIYNSETNNFLFENELTELVNSIESQLEAYTPENTRAELWSYDLRHLYLSEILNRDQKRATFLSVILVGIFTSLFFWSIRYGLLSLIPIATGLMCNFTVMALFGIPLDVITMMVSSVAIGVGVDDAIHFLLQYRRLSAIYPGNQRRIITDTFRITGRPIFHTTVSVVGGLIVLVFASFKGISYFGLLVAITLTAALIGTLFFLPAILLLFPEGRLRKPGARTEPPTPAPRQSDGSQEDG